MASEADKMPVAEARRVLSKTLEDHRKLVAEIPAWDTHGQATDGAEGREFCKALEVALEALDLLTE